jgi:hypothetical protein
MVYKKWGLPTWAEVWESLTRRWLKMCTVCSPCQVPWLEWLSQSLDPNREKHSTSWAPPLTCLVSNCQRAWEHIPLTTPGHQRNTFWHGNVRTKERPAHWAVADPTPLTWFEVYLSPREQNARMWSDSNLSRKLDSWKLPWTTGLALPLSCDK